MSALPENDEPSRDFFANAITVSVVLVTLVVATVGYLQSRSSKAGDRASATSDRLNLDALAAQVRSSDAARLQLDLFIQSELQRRTAATAQEQARLDPTANRDELWLEKERWEHLARLTQQRARRAANEGALPPITRNGPLGPEQDPLFPARFFAESYSQQLQLFARADAANEEASERGGQVSSYVAILAVLAVAIYLFSFSLTPEGRENRAIFAAFASLLAVGGIVGAITTAIPTPSPAPDSAANAFADAEVAFSAGEYAAAVPHYSDALRDRPDFSRAHLGRAIARAVMDSPDFGTVTFALTSDRARVEAVEDLEDARSLGLEDQTLLNNLGYHQIVLGMKTQSEDTLREGIANLREAERLAPSALFSALLPLDIGLAYLALGDPSAARETYTRGAEQIVFLDPDHRFTNDPVTQRDLLATALTTLELARKLSDGALDSQVARTKELIIGLVHKHLGQLGQGGPPTGGGQLRRLSERELFVTSNELELHIPEFLVQRGQAVTIVWYRREGNLGWAALAPALEIGPAPFNAPALDRITDYLSHSTPANCLRAGLYRAEVYVNGRLRAAGKTRGGGSGLIPASDSSIGYRLCRPDSWEQAPRELAGLRNGFLAKDGSSGVYVFRTTTTPDQAVEQDRAPKRFLRHRLNTIVRRFAGYLPRGLTPLRELPFRFLALPYELVREYSFDGGLVYAAAAIQPEDRSVLSAFVFGPRGFIRGGKGPLVFDSITQDPVLSELVAQQPAPPNDNAR